MEVKEPDMAYGNYSYADYLTWTMEEMVEVIKGRVFKMTAPKRIHQKISWNLSREIGVYLKNKKCKAYAAPFDVRLPIKSKRNEDIFTVVQPDICVICDLEKLDDYGCVGAPDLVIEILSEGNNKKELKNKYEVYEESGVKEYWIINSMGQTLTINTLVNGKYQASRLLTSGDEITTPILPEFILSLEDVFDNLN
ncbi:MAG: Uma2 family endonuclease [bacterium]|nr:Uma2 family endonuclease [bacterium]